MNRYVVSPQALADLQAIWDYIGIEQDSPVAASDQLRRFREKFALLATQPLMGELRGSSTGTAHLRGRQLRHSLLSAERWH